ncbi:hypothetical protein OAQ84_00820 [Bdellovibrionales bacterium]|nr:hypothetical protein [Bdellovibrionales bacterium]
MSFLNLGSFALNKMLTYLVLIFLCSSGYAKEIPYKKATFLTSCGYLLNSFRKGALGKNDRSTEIEKYNNSYSEFFSIALPYWFPTGVNKNGKSIVPYIKMYTTFPSEFMNRKFFFESYQLKFMQGDNIPKIVNQAKDRRMQFTVAKLNESQTRLFDFSHEANTEHLSYTLQSFVLSTVIKKISVIPPSIEPSTGPGNSDRTSVKITSGLYCLIAAINTCRLY